MGEEGGALMRSRREGAATCRPTTRTAWSNILNEGSAGKALQHGPSLPDVAELRASMKAAPGRRCNTTTSRQPRTGRRGLNEGSAGKALQPPVSAARYSACAPQ